MEGAVCKTPGFLCETPSGEQCFKFPPALALSVDRVKTSAFFPMNLRSGRSFTPYKNSLFVRSPEFSPIEIPDIERDLSNVIRLPKEKIRKARADSTVFEEMALQVPSNLHPEGLENFLRYTNSGADNQNLRLMPPPHGKRSRKSMPATTRRNFIPKVREKSLRRLSNLSELKSSKMDLDQRVIRWLSHHTRRETRVFVDPNESVSVLSILSNIHMSKYIQNFTREQMDLRVFLSLTDEDLLKIGISNEKDRRCIRRAIKYYEI